MLVLQRIFSAVVRYHAFFQSHRQVDVAPHPPVETLEEPTPAVPAQPLARRLLHGKHEFGPPTTTGRRLAFAEHRVPGPGGKGFRMDQGVEDLHSSQHGLGHGRRVSSLQGRPDDGVQEAVRILLHLCHAPRAKVEVVLDPQVSTDKVKRFYEAYSLLVRHGWGFWCG